MSTSCVQPLALPTVTSRWQRTSIVWLGLGISWLLMLASLNFPAFVVDWPRGTTSEYPSLGLFLFGWLGLFSVLDGDFSMIGWLANPWFFLTSLLLISRQAPGTAAITGALSVVFVCCCGLLTTALMNEAGHTANVVAFTTGFQLWATAICGQAGLAVCLWLPGAQVNLKATGLPRVG